MPESRDVVLPGSARHQWPLLDNPHIPKTAEGKPAAERQAIKLVWIASEMKRKGRGWTEAPSEAYLMRSQPERHTVERGKCWLRPSSVVVRDREQRDIEFCVARPGWLRMLARLGARLRFSARASAESSTWLQSGRDRARAGCPRHRYCQRAQDTRRSARCAISDGERRVGAGPAACARSAGRVRSSLLALRTAGTERGERRACAPLPGKSVVSSWSGAHLATSASKATGGRARGRARWVRASNNHTLALIASRLAQRLRSIGGRPLRENAFRVPPA